MNFNFDFSKYTINHIIDYFKVLVETAFHIDFDNNEFSIFGFEFTIGLGNAGSKYPK